LPRQAWHGDRAPSGASIVAIGPGGDCNDPFWALEDIEFWETTAKAVTESRWSQLC
jgi:hypothetical protein